MLGQHIPSPCFDVAEEQVTPDVQYRATVSPNCQRYSSYLENRPMFYALPIQSYLHTYHTMTCELHEDTNKQGLATTKTFDRCSWMKIDVSYSSSWGNNILPDVDSLQSLNGNAILATWTSWLWSRQAQITHPKSQHRTLPRSYASSCPTHAQSTYISAEDLQD
jgi:hypothetical protein